MNKRKQYNQATSLKPYWLIFGVLAVTLLIPFRFINLWLMTMLYYAGIIVICGFVITQLIERNCWRTMLVPLLMVCIMLSSFHVYTHRNYFQHPCIDYPASISEKFVKTVRCTEGCGADQHMIRLGNSPIGIQTFFGWYIPYCLT